MTNLLPLIADLEAEQSALDDLVAPLDDATFDLPTPAPCWRIREQIAHLAAFDVIGELAVADPAGFTVQREAADREPEAYGVNVIEPLVAMDPQDLLRTWREGRDQLLTTLRQADPRARVPWYGPAMSVASMVTARLMETWAHGQDVVDALGRTPVGSDRLRHVAYIGYRARPFSYAVRERDLPPTDVRLDLTSPSGESWTFGDEALADVVQGPALDFCLVITRRRHPDDTCLVATGVAAQEWLGIGQAYAGEPGVGRAPGQFPHLTN